MNHVGEGGNKGKGNLRIGAKKVLGKGEWALASPKMLMLGIARTSSALRSLNRIFDHWFYLETTIHNYKQHNISDGIKKEPPLTRRDNGHNRIGFRF